MAFDGIDILKLFAGDLSGFHDDYRQLPEDARTANFDVSKSKKLMSSHKRWNVWLEKCLVNQDISELTKVRRGLQVGMSEVVKKRLSTDMLAEMYVRWLSSIEKTARKIIFIKHPLPPVSHDNFKVYQKAKKLRDAELEKFWIKSSY